jgi:5-methylcytosine-specific restriction endonuclease McrA
MSATKQKFYHSKIWKQTRELVLRRDQFTCKMCGLRGDEVHHIKPLTDKNIDTVEISLNEDNLMTLCKECHSKITAGYDGDLPIGYIFDEQGHAVRV